LIVLIGLFLIFQTISLIRYINKINVIIENFFLAHLSGEAPASFAIKTRKDEFSKLYKYFAQVNKDIEKIRVNYEIQNNYFKTIVDQTTVGLISYTGDGVIEFINDAARKMFGIYVIRNLRKLDTYKEGFSQYIIALEQRKTELVSLVIHGELIQLSVKKTQFKTGERLLYLVSLQNIRAELDSKEMESWQKLIRVLTHEIMNSMTPITSLAKTISRIYRDQESGRIIQPKEVTIPDIDKTVNAMDIFESRAEGLAEFVRNFTDVNKLPKPKFQKVNIQNLLQKIQILFDDPNSVKPIQLIISCHPSIQINADQNLLEQVLINLVKNSLEACSETPVPIIKLSAHSQYDRTIIEIEDNGRGIPKVVMENIFVPFFTTKEKGSGIGLSLSRQIIRMHGGTLDFNSVPGKKTVFTIRL
jgi:nitrogen fixation/metabolism regulation signal transduction histidine kinase